MPTLRYELNSDAVRHLAAVDPILSRLILLIGPCEMKISEDHFSSLVDAVIGQQLSTKAARSIAGRLRNGLGRVTPETILAAEHQSLRTAGLSKNKITYIRDLAACVVERRLDLGLLDKMPDSQVVAQLTEVRGIGPWTAEMFLIFTLGRLDVFSESDGALRRIMRMSYGVDSVPREIASLWAPYRTLASLYLWRALDLRENKALA